METKPTPTAAKFTCNFMLNDLRGLMKKRKMEHFPIAASVVGMFARDVEAGIRDKNIARQSLLKMATENADKGIYWTAQGESVGNKWSDFETEEERQTERVRLLSSYFILKDDFFKITDRRTPEERAKQVLIDCGEMTESY